MNIHQQNSACKVVSIETVHLVSSTQSQSSLALLSSQGALNLAELADSIRADHKLALLVTESACMEFGWPWLSVEDAIVLLGVKRLRSLIANPARRGRSASQSLWPFHRNRTIPAARLCLLETSLEKAE